MKNKKGFTLIEMLGVVALIAIVFLISYTTILNHLKNSQDKIDQYNLDLVTSAAKDYISDNQDKYLEIDDSVFCIDINTLIDNNYIDEDIITAQGNSILSKTVKVTYKKDNNSQYEIVGECSQSFPVTGKIFAKYLLKNVNDVSLTTYEADSYESHQMYTFEHPATAQTGALTDYRYIGKSPYNYVDFNCNDNGENCETWRIVGIFTVENGSKIEQRIKIVKEELMGGRSWNSGGNNDWITATLNEYLNGEYYNNVLTKSAKSMIDPAKYYLGGRIWDSTTHHGGAVSMYTFERGTARYNSSQSLNWTGNVGMLYPSDYTYTYSNGIDNVCYTDGWYCETAQGGDPTKGWLHKTTNHWWLISPYASSGSVAFTVSSKGYVNYGHGVQTAYGVRPVVYLKSEVRVVSGDGTKDNPYKISM